MQNDNRKIREILKRARLIYPFAFSLLGLVLVYIFAFVHIRSMGVIGTDLGLLILAVSMTLVGVITSAVLLKNQLLRPLARLQESVSQVCQGEPGARVLHEDLGVLEHLSHDIDSVYEELSDLYEDMDNRVERQTRRLAQKTASLKILYDVAASINQSDTLDALLLRFLRIFKEMVNGKTAIVRLVSRDGRMRLVGVIGLDNKVATEQELLPVQLCQCGKALTSGDLLCEHDAEACSRMNNRVMFSAEQIEVISVPLEYHDDTLGIYTIYVEQPGVSGREDIMELLTTIGSHLGIAIAKQRSDEEAHRLSIVEERTALAHELHDSLAQTLAGLRFQVRMLADTLTQNQDYTAASHDLDRIRNGLDEANRELRALLGNFRAPIDQRGLIPALRRMTKRFSEETGIQVFLQLNCRSLRLHPSEEMQMVRIVQESLANIRKHAQAHMVRVMLSCRDNELQMLIEDDGVGFEQAPIGRPGEHIGLSIMEERARRMGGELRIESEPGEGTRVEMFYRPTPAIGQAE